MTRVRITTGGIPELKDAIGRASDLLKDPRPALEVIGETVLEDGVRRAFREQESADGTPWPPLAESTLKARVPGRTRRRASYSDGKPLHRRGAYRNSWNWQLRKAGQASVSIGTPYAYAKYHEHLPQYDYLDRGIIPKRRALPIDDRGNLTPGMTSKLLTAIDDLIEQSLQHA